jgi:hypothetical protein
MSQRPEHVPALPVERAFVVQFRAEAALEPGGPLGRVEHVVSGQATHFHTLEELLAFLTQQLTTRRTCASPEGELP